jgi:hypothetical protein
MAINPSEADVTAMRNPGSGAITDPNQAVNPPANAPTPKTDAEANPDKTGFDAASRLKSNDRMPVDFDFEVTNDPDPRGDAEVGDANAQDIPTAEADAISRMIKIKYRGEEEEIPEDKAVTMLQQFKSVESKYGPLMELSRRISEQTGVTDPNQLANMMGTSMLNAMNKENAEANPTGNPVETPAELTNDPRVLAKNVMSDENAVKMAKNFFEENGLQPTDDAFMAMQNMFKYSKAVEEAATILPTLMEDVNNFKEAQKMNATRANQTLVDSQAAATAKELGIDTEADFNDFISWVEMQDSTFGNYKQAIGNNPAAMDKAIRDYHAITTGNKSVAEQTAMKMNVEKNISRAGGETVASRGSDVPTGKGPQQDFSTQMLDLL